MPDPGYCLLRRFAHKIATFAGFWLYSLVILRNQLQIGYTLPNCNIELVSVYNTGESFAGFLASVCFAKEILILGKDYAS